MSENINYPIKYAVLEMTESFWGCSFKPVSYVVSKAYVVSETLTYHANQIPSKSYQVVFPFKEKDKIGMYETRDIPRYNLEGECINCEQVDELFDTFEEAKAASTALNDKLRVQSIFINFRDEFWKEKYAKDLEKFNTKLALYLDFEQLLMMVEEPMQITEEPILSNTSLSR